MEKNTWKNAFPLSHEVFEDGKFKSLNLSAIVLYCYLSKHANRFADEEGWFYRSLNDLTKDTGLSIGSVKSAKKELIAGGFIETKSHNYSSLGQKLASNYRIKWRNRAKNDQAEG